MQIFLCLVGMGLKASPLDWGLLSVLFLGYSFTLSFPLLAASTSDSLGNALTKCCGREVRQSEGIRAGARWCVISPSQLLVLSGTPQEWEPSLHRVLIANCSAGLSDCFIWATSWKRCWEKNIPKIRMERWIKRFGQGLGFRSPPLTFRETSSYYRAPKLDFYSLPPHLIIHFIITAAQTACGRATCHQEEIRID